MLWTIANHCPGGCRPGLPGRGYATVLVQKTAKTLESNKLASLFYKWKLFCINLQKVAVLIFSLSRRIWSDGQGGCKSMQIWTDGRGVGANRWRSSRQFGATTYDRHPPTPKSKSWLRHCRGLGYADFCSVQNQALWKGGVRWHFKLMHLNKVYAASIIKV